MTDRVAADLATFSRMVDESPDLQRFVRSPLFSAEAQVGAIGALLDKAGIHGISRQLPQARRVQAPPVRDPRHDPRLPLLDDAVPGVSRAEVTVAEPLADHHMATPARTP